MDAILYIAMFNVNKNSRKLEGEEEGEQESEKETENERNERKRRRKEKKETLWSTATCQKQCAILRICVSSLKCELRANKSFNRDSFVLLNSIHFLTYFTLL